MSKSHANDSSVDENEFYLSNLNEQYKRSLLEGTSTAKPPQRPRLYNGGQSIHWLLFKQETQDKDVFWAKETGLAEQSWN